MWAHYVLLESLTRSRFAPRENLTPTADDQVAWLGETVSSFGQCKMCMGLKVETQGLDNCSNP
jgi:hypothetical protein